VTWRDAELTAADHMRHLGFADAMETGAGADRGLDATSREAAAQVKLYQQQKTGRPDVQRLAGAAARYTHKLFYSNAYTPAAISFANEAGVALFQFKVSPTAPHEPPHVEAVNRVAVDLEHQAGVRGADPVTQRTLELDRKITVRVQETKARCAAVKRAARGPIPGSRRKQQRVLARRREALALVVKSLATLEKMQAKKRTLWRRDYLSNEAARYSKRAADMLGVRYP
jgi:hypothetical protein